jgi:hypothetical protein
LTEVLGSVVTSIPLGAQIVVISTRDSRLDDVGREEVFVNKHRHQRTLGRVVWLDVGHPQFSALFELD